MTTTQKMRFANRVLIITLVLVALDFALKLWVFYHYEEGIASTTGFIGLARIHTVRMSFGMNSLAKYFPSITRLLWLIFLGFVFIRARRTQTTPVLQIGATLSFVGLAANHVDTFLFPLLDSQMPQFPAYVQMNNFYIGAMSDNIAAVVGRVGLVVLFLGALMSFQSFRALFRRPQP